MHRDRRQICERRDRDIPQDREREYDGEDRDHEGLFGGGLRFHDQENDQREQREQQKIVVQARLYVAVQHRRQRARRAAAGTVQPGQLMEHALRQPFRMRTARRDEQQDDAHRRAQGEEHAERDQFLPAKTLFHG